MCCFYSSVITHHSLLNQIDQGEQENPHHVHEMPVQSENFDADVIAGGIPAFHRVPDDQQPPQYPDDDVYAVKGGQGIEALAELVQRLVRCLIRVERDTMMCQFGILDA